MINMDFSQACCIHSHNQEWLQSPLAGVWRKPLEREAAEHGHVTSIVKYEANSYFKAHSHPLGEEIFVLEGTFSDETGDFGPGTYIRNPPGSQHKPFSKDGCIIYVKLNQFGEDDLESKRINTLEASWREGIGQLEVMPLHQFNNESITLVKWPAGEIFQPHHHTGGEEIFVISGEFIDEHGSYPQYTWLRSPHNSHHFPRVEKETIILVKTGHLPQ
ncbi:cupin domain-containing protein [Lentisphaera profundi]|uniref:Cupin domain-containing protein n=1 Tax=Lentisphaera profundi TaxID=1658616 RepID=A0ABY7VTB7_9BACT|nr:cupin domain-containing protein [Lentisphaera profundi]WDE96071.1 cupin domain-containing protein [Lentisphaera profundi]